MTCLSIVIPVLNDADALQRVLRDLRDALGERFLEVDVLVVDGGSHDTSSAVARDGGARVLAAERGRATQLAAGVANAAAAWIWMLHADSRVDARAIDALWRVVATDAAAWGRFDVRLSGRGVLLRLVAWSMNVRSRITGIATGDQGIFVHRALLDRVGGVPQQALMEDVELSARLRRIARPVCLRAAIVTSSRRWQTRGIVRTIALMWWLRALYALGVAPARLKRIYYGG